MFTTNLVNLYNRNIFETSLYIYIFQDEKCRLMRNLSLSMVVDLTYFKIWILLVKIILSFKYQRFTSSDCKDIGIRQFEFVTKTHFFCLKVEKITYFFIHVRKQLDVINIGGNITLPWFPSIWLGTVASLAMLMML